MPSNSIIFIAGTDTDIGKTFVCGQLAAAYGRARKTVITQKWVQTGSSTSSDIDAHWQFMGKPTRLNNDIEKAINPYRFSFPASPHLAASLEHQTLSPETIQKALLLLKKEFGNVLVEGSGGLMVPFNDHHLQIDLIQDLGLSVFLVAPNRLGTLNHTLLSIAALKEKQIPLLGLALNTLSLHPKTEIEHDNQRFLTQRLHCPVFDIPYQSDGKIFDQILSTF